MSGANLQHLLAMILYMAAVVGIGIYFAGRANKDAESYFLGGRSLGPWVTAFSAEASDMSGYLLMGLPDNVQPEVKISEHLTSFRGNLMDKIERYPGYFTIDSVSV